MLGMWRGKVSPSRKEMWFGEHPVTANMGRTVVMKNFGFEGRHHQNYKLAFWFGDSPCSQLFNHLWNWANSVWAYSLAYVPRVSISAFYLEFVFHLCPYLVKLLRSKSVYTFYFPSNVEVVIMNQPSSCKCKIEYSIKIVFSINLVPP